MNALETFAARLGEAVASIAPAIDRVARRIVIGLIGLTIITQIIMAMQP
jgi:hypothetical protein